MNTLQPTFRFGTVGSPKSTPPKPGGSPGAILQIASLGLSALELGWVQAVRVSEETCKLIRANAIEKDIAISVHAPYFINLNGTEEEWPKSRQRLMDAAYWGNLAGATDIIFHPGSYFDRPASEVLPLAIQRLQACVSELREKGNPVRLRPETMGKSALLGSFEDTLEMSKNITGVLPCIDFAHLHARPGDGSINTRKEWDTLLDAYAQTLGNEALSHLHIHLSGIAYTPKGEKNHLPLRESDLNLKDLFQSLADHHVGGRILCESPILEEDAVYMRDLWQSLTA